MNDTPANDTPAQLKLYELKGIEPRKHSPYYPIWYEMYEQARKEQEAAERAQTTT